MDTHLQLTTDKTLPAYGEAVQWGEPQLRWRQRLENLRHEGLRRHQADRSRRDSPGWA